MNPISLHIVTALNCEAKPLIDFYRLSKVRSQPFDYYTGTKGEQSNIKIKLIVTGIGAQNMATACGWLAAQSDDTKNVWLNVGTAGHKSFSTGTIVRVHRAVDIMSGQSHYPALTAKWSGQSSALLTYESACTEYPEDALVDMEGTAYFNAARLFASTELVQSLKVVSDNEQHSVERLNAALISDIIEPHAILIDAFATQLIKILPEEQSLLNELDLIAHLHSTVSQRQQYLELVSKLKSLHQFDDKLIKQSAKMPDLLKQLTQQLASTQPSLEDMVT